MLNIFLNIVLILTLIMLIIIVPRNSNYIITAKEYIPIFSVSLIQNKNIYYKLKIGSLYITIITLILFLFIYNDLTFNNIYIQYIDTVIFDIPVSLDNISLYFILLLLILYPILILSS